MLKITRFSISCGVKQQTEEFITGKVVTFCTDSSPSRQSIIMIEQLPDTSYTHDIQEFIRESG